MAKLTKKQFFEHNKEAVFYKWEFLRRNKLYTKERKVVVDKMSKVFSDKKSIKVLKTGLKALEDFCVCWGLIYISGLNPPSPKKKFKMLTPGEKEMLLPYATEPKWVSFACLKKLIKSDKEPEFLWAGILPIKINLNMPQRKIIREIEHILQIAKDIRKKYGHKDIVKHHYEYYSELLKIYDLRKNKKMKYKDIAKVVYKLEKSEVARGCEVGTEQDEDRIRMYEDKISKAYKKAEELVEFEHRNIW